MDLQEDIFKSVVFTIRFHKCGRKNKKNKNKKLNTINTEIQKMIDHDYVSKEYIKGPH